MSSSNKRSDPQVDKHLASTSGSLFNEQFQHLVDRSMHRKYAPTSVGGHSLGRRTAGG